MADIFALTQEALLGSDIELIDVERAPLGVLRVVIDHPEGVVIDHCEWVSKQLSRVFEVENVDYARLEVSSPGIDRPLRTLRDFVRFAGARVELRFYEAVDNQKVFKGVLISPEDVTVDNVDADTQFVLELEQASGNVRDLTFTFDEVDRAKLDPVLDFKGRKR
ncbi:ribosome maturation factor RimP [Paenalcaligenes suwonensis]|uniref:ribosome maturation factor RimP n=1 Tax=Paenalcaligenes suwonensis TaxID=1202713 RepID=UPI00140C6BC5|nr:ribosome maturation factor RimP [Paenalcaligenes suwonensis]NHC62001.1 ribosome maturation factor RimP [Paenalcaligenes suwonensis]